VVEPLGGGAFRVSREGRSARAWAVSGPDATWVYLDGQVSRVTGDDEGAATLRRLDPDAMTAPMPATVTAVHALPGAVVEAGMVLVTLEAMKMELQVRAPRAGTVSRVGCRVGDLVQPGVPLVELS